MIKEVPTHGWRALVLFHMASCSQPLGFIYVAVSARKQAPRAIHVSACIMVSKQITRPTLQDSRGAKIDSISWWKGKKFWAFFQSVTWLTLGHRGQKGAEIHEIWSIKFDAKETGNHLNCMFSFPVRGHVLSILSLETQSVVLSCVKQWASHLPFFGMNTPLGGGDTFKHKWLLHLSLPPGQ